MSIFSLKEKYDYFIVPAYKITVDGTAVPPQICYGITVDQTVGAVSGGCQFTVSGIFDEGSNKLSGDAGMFQVGKTVKVSIGYGSNLKAVFTGFISQLAYKFEEKVEIDVICLDARALMRRSRPVIINRNKSAEDIANAVLGKYSPLIGSKEVSLPELIKGNIAVDTNDLEFIMTECIKRGKVFFIRDDKAFITEPSGEKCLELDWAEYRLTHRFNYLNCNYKGIGLDFATMESYTVTESTKQSGSQKNMTAQDYYVPLVPGLSQSAGKTVIKALAHTDTLNAQTGTITCFGIPEVEIGKTIKLNKSPLQTISGTDTFFVTAVRHTIDSAFMTTIEFSLGG